MGTSLRSSGVRTVSEVAKRLRVTPRTVRNWCSRGLVWAELTPSKAAWRIHVDEDGHPVEL